MSTFVPIAVDGWVMWGLGHILSLPEAADRELRAILSLAGHSTYEG